ncbi:metallophosphoesterase [Planctomicrobium sp. SH664]|uniref:metallophosphoesterase n=1 Tax=Planctomicrobium sp. SH664 TaxID=3448125 RepID=UPI003F5C0936
MSVQLERSISGPVAVIGDVHGQVEHLGRILEQLQALPDYQRRWIVFIGDLVDRGPDPKGALDIVTDLLVHHPRTTVVSGNHEMAMAAALGLLPTPAYSDWDQRWLDHYGSQSTFRSYGINEFGDLNALREQMPQSHQDLLADLPWSVEHPEYFFVHAGLDPNSPFSMQREILRTRDYTLNRPQWLCSKSLPFELPPSDCPATVVSGHVKVPQVMFGDRRLLIDTTGGDGGSLSCVLLPEMKILHSNPEFVPVAAKPEPKKRGWLW